MIIDGKKIAQDILSGLMSLPKPQKFLAIIYVGENPASQSFINKKKEIADRLEIDFRLYKFKEDIQEDMLRGEVLKISGEKDCGGIIVQLPLPTGIKSENVLNAIPSEKDVDVLGLGGVLISPPSVSTAQEIIRRLDLDLKALRVVVLGLGVLIGRPISSWLKGKTKELTLLDKGSDLSELKNADLVILGTGQPGIILSEELKENCVVLDFGTNLENGKLRGDLKVDPKTKITFTPTPGGTGPILISKIFENFYKLNNKKQD